MSATGYQWYKNGMPLKGETNAYYTTEELDFTAQYYAMVTTKDGEILYTCPMTPVRRDHGLKVYPNPVKAGETITIEANIENIGNKPMTAKVVNLHGNTMQIFYVDSNLKTIEAPTTAGIYLLTFEIEGGTTKTFKLLVK